MEETKRSGIKITVIENEDLKDEKVLRNNLIKFYDAMNEAIQKLPEEERKDYLLTEEKINQMMKSEDYKFI